MRAKVKRCIVILHFSSCVVLHRKQFGVAVKVSKQIFKHDAVGHPELGGLDVRRCVVNNQGFRTRLRKCWLCNQRRSYKQGGKQKTKYLSHEVLLNCGIS